MVKDIEIPAVRKIVPEENCPPVRDRVWFRISVGIRAGSGGAIFLEPKYRILLFKVLMLLLYCGKSRSMQLEI